MTGQRRDPDDSRTADVERAVRSWLHGVPDQPPDTLASSALDVTRRNSQRATWLARWHQRSGGPTERLLRVSAAASVAVAVVVAAVALWPAIAGPPDGVAGPESSTAVISPAPTMFDGRVQATIDLDERVTALGSGFGSLWAGDETGRLLRIDPAGGATPETIDLGAVACGPIMPAATSLWLTTCGEGITPDVAITSRVDPTTMAVTDRYEEDGGDGVGVGAMNGLVWFISDFEAGTLTAVDAETGDHVRDLTIGGPIRHLTAGFGSLWVSPIGRAVVLRIDPGDGREQAAIALSGDAGYLATAADAIWVAESHQWLVARIDPVADRVASEIEAAPGVNQLIVATDGRVLALANEELLAIDGATSSVVDRVPVPRHVAFDGVATYVLALDEGNVWFADQSSIVQIAPR